MQSALIRTPNGTIPIRNFAVPLLAGDDGTEQTVGLMWQKVHGLDRDDRGRPSMEGDTHPGVRAFALRATHDCPDRDDWAQAQALYHAVQCAVRFRGEKDEQVQTPWLTLGAGDPALAAGDCDDMTVLLVALLASIGIPAKIRTVQCGRSGAYDHVYALVGVRRNGKVAEWRAIDPTVQGTEPGWHPPNERRARVWNDHSLITENPSARLNVPRGTYFDSSTRGLPRGEDHSMQGYGCVPAPTMGDLGFFHLLKKLAGGALQVGEGFATGGPAGAATAGARIGMKAIHRPKLLHAAQGAFSQFGLGDVDSALTKVNRELPAVQAGIDAYMRQRHGPVVRNAMPGNAEQFSAPASDSVPTAGASKHWIGNIPNEDVAIGVSLVGLAAAFLIRK